MTSGHSSEAMFPLEVSQIRVPTYHLHTLTQFYPSERREQESSHMAFLAFNWKDVKNLRNEILKWPG